MAKEKGVRKWWYNILATLMPVVIFLALDYAMSGTFGWSLWVGGCMLFLALSYTLLERYGRE